MRFFALLSHIPGTAAYELYHDLCIALARYEVKATLATASRLSVPRPRRNLDCVWLAAVALDKAQDRLDAAIAQAESAHECNLKSRVVTQTTVYGLTPGDLN